MRRRPPLSIATDKSPAATTELRDGAFGNATGLACRECGHLVELGPHYACPECFGPLEVAYDFPAVTREEIADGPRNIWRYKSLLPVPTTGCIRLRFSTHEHLDITSDVEAGTLTVDRSHASLDSRADGGQVVVTTAFAPSASRPAVRVLIDGSVVEFGA